jgi:leucyl aminopeptidase
MVTFPLHQFFSILLSRAAWEKGVIKAQAQNVARNLADTPANLMTPTIFAQVSLMPAYVYVAVSFNTVLQVLQVCL